MKSVILNAGTGAWAFEAIAGHLSQVLQVEIATEPAARNYLLGWDKAEAPRGACFIPYEAIQLVSDKRKMAEVFAQRGVATPRTYLPESQEEIDRIVDGEPATQWVLKWPTGCGGSGHRLYEKSLQIPTDWPRPFLLQEFIRLETPEVYRLYAVAGETFGWNVRRFPAGKGSSPFVAHAQGAQYEAVGDAPTEATIQARQALAATGLIDSFGCADLMKTADGGWVVLEVNTDGIYNHVDRDVSVGNIPQEIDRRLAKAFQEWVSSQSHPPANTGK